jgi:dimethyl sulfoxide reductase iron-sulfur subunit
MARYGLVIDVARCTGCYACVVACKSENSTRPGISWIRIQEDEEGEYPQVSRSYTPLLCMQCGEMPCAKACPSRAIFIGDGGIVNIEPDKCLCCDNHPCINACPFDVLQVNKGKSSYFPDYLTPFEKEAYEIHRDGVVEKCNLCSHRIDAGQLPACVQACPSQAILFGDHDDPNCTLSKLISHRRTRDLEEELKVDPSVVYIQD